MRSNGLTTNIAIFSDSSASSRDVSSNPKSCSQNMPVIIMDCAKWRRKLQLKGRVEGMLKSAI